MLVAVITLFLSFFISALIIRLKYFKVKSILDSDTLSPQKFHIQPVPRIGGLSIFLSLFIGSLIRLSENWESGFLALTLLLCGTPAFMIGFFEDITKNIAPSRRLVTCLISAILAIYLLDIKVVSIDVYWIDPMFKSSIIAILLSSFMIVGLTNAYNIIDGFNGLVSIVAVMTLLAIGYVAFRNDDYAIIFIVVMVISGILGFFSLNYPRGLIFLGDGGAYLLGFLIAGLSILLNVKHPNVSPWFSLLINIYPIFETLFSIWRKLVLKKTSPSVPDGVHLHMLIYGRVSKWLSPGNKTYYGRNSKTSPFLWLLSGLAVFPAVVFWNHTFILQIFSLIFCMTYILIYKAIVKFKFQKWIKVQ
jgi:UDP-GlcNAc:undecaprenyl-phosphate/decaprenyl-phosphate GlcNAc-1-phosphate transferase